MPVLLQVNQISKAYGAHTVLDGATASFASDQKIGVIGRNGAGKSTLCRILTGHEPADTGSVVPNSELRLSYLEQHDIFQEGETVIDFLMRRSGRENWECASTAARFRIRQEMLPVPARNLAGGYQTRVKLAAMLLKDPNFLVLDEPSNYLDLSTLILLENFLRDFPGGTLVVSHDREFLKRTCDHTLEIESGRLTLYPGTIEEYFEFKETERTRQEAENRGIRKKRDQLEEFISRFRAKASTASRAQSKMKQLEKLQVIEIGHQLSSVRFHIPQVERKAGVALSCEDLVIGYPEKEVARGIDLTIERGQHVAILGDNGQGKTTFLRTLAGDLPPRGGNFRWGSGIKLAYYAQHVFSALHPEDTIYSHLASTAPDGVTNPEILAMAGCFLFKGDDVKKKVSVLSGGERARLVLAGILLSKSQALLLDEVTNHLDFETVEALGRALKKFHGALLFISHDRTFVNLLSTQILEFRDGRLRRYPGSYEEYVYSLEQAAQGTEGEGTEDPKPDPAHPQPGPQEEEKPAGEVPKKEKTKSEISKIGLQMRTTEQRIKRLTQERDKLLEEIRKNPFHYSRDRNAQLKDLQVSIEKAEEAWCTLQEKLDREGKSL